MNDILDKPFSLRHQRTKEQTVQQQPIIFTKVLKWQFFIAITLSLSMMGFWLYLDYYAPNYLFAYLRAIVPLILNGSIYLVLWLIILVVLTVSRYIRKALWLRQQVLITTIKEVTELHKKRAEIEQELFFVKSYIQKRGSQL